MSRAVILRTLDFETKCVPTSGSQQTNMDVTVVGNQESESLNVRVCQWHGHGARAVGEVERPNFKGRASAIRYFSKAVIQFIFEQGAVFDLFFSAANA